MTLPLVSIVTPSLNHARFIRETIESVLGQDYGRLEYIIMDGGSSDETAAIAASYAPRLQFFSEPDRGQAHAINKGFQRARGEIVAWLNSDDTLEPHAVSKAVAALADHPTVAAVYGEGHQLDLHGRVRQRFPFTEPFNLWKLTFLADYILQQTVFFRRDRLAEVGWLDESLHYGMDWDLLIRLGQRYGLHYLPEFLGNIREYPEAKSFAGGRRRFAELASVLRRHTGRRFPPGWCFYGLDTYDKIIAAAIRGVLPGPPGRLLASHFVALCRHRLAHVQNHSQGLYPDGWAGPVLHWMVPAGLRRAEFHGEIAASITALKPQSLKLFVDGKLATQSQVSGRFHIAATLSGASAALLRVEASRAIRDSHPEIGSRRICWQVRGPLPGQSG